MSLDFCCKCGCWIGSLEGVIRQGVDNQPEVVCNDCQMIAQTLSKPAVDGNIAKLVSAEIIDCERCCASGYSL